MFLPVLCILMNIHVYKKDKKDKKIKLPDEPSRARSLPDAVVLRECLPQTQRRERGPACEKRRRCVCVDVTRSVGMSTSIYMDICQTIYRSISICLRMCMCI